jgi:transcriptional regulator with XRE-family HTH domain
MAGTTTSGTFGVYLRQLRRSRRQSLAGVAARAGVSERSLSRWENGATRPRPPELDQVLRALEASPAEEARARGLAGAARALVRWQREAASDAAALLGEPILPPGPGTLLRALRHRQGLSLVETAGRLGLQPSSVSRWERSEMHPAAAHLEALLDCVEARPQERAALRSALAGAGPLAGWTPEEGSLTLEALEGEFDRLSDYEMWQEPPGLMDLGFIALEARLWSRAPRQPEAPRLLARVCAYHAFWLSNAGRLSEAAPLAWRARRLCEPDGPETHAYLMATIISARWAAAGGVECRARARRYLEAALPWERHPELQAWALSELSQCLLAQGDTEAAVRAAREARDLAGRYDSGEGWHRKMDLVSVLLRAGQVGAALDWLATDPLMPEAPSDCTRELLLRSEACLAAGHRAGARDCLDRAAALFRDHSLETLRPDLHRRTVHFRTRLDV